LQNSRRIAYHASSMAEETLTLTVQKLASGGDGIAFSDGRVVFIPLTIPGEKVVCRLVSGSRDYARAVLLDVLEPSPDRVVPPCPIFGLCGGCNLQHITIERQRELKVGSVRETFLRMAKFDPGPLQIISGAEYGYRNRAEFHFSGDHGIGFMASDSSESVRARDCPVVAPSVRAWLRVQNKKSRPDKDFRAAYGNRDRFTVFGQDERLYIEGRDAVARAVVAGREYSFPLRHFFQSNVEMASLLLQDVIDGVSGDRAVDLYCGSGLFAKRLAERCGEVVCVESDPVALEAARVNVTGKGVAFRAKTSEEWIKSPVSSAGWRNPSPTPSATVSGTAETDVGAAGRQARPRAQVPIDWVTVDPPRTGLSPELRAWLSRAAIGAINYISCDHVTLARDLAELNDAGWRIDSLRLYDFYPQTGRIEVFARLFPDDTRRRHYGENRSL